MDTTRRGIAAAVSRVHGTRTLTECTVKCQCIHHATHRYILTFLLASKVNHSLSVVLSTVPLHRPANMAELLKHPIFSYGPRNPYDESDDESDEDSDGDDAQPGPSNVKRRRLN